MRTHIHINVPAHLHTRPHASTCTQAQARTHAHACMHAHAHTQANTLGLRVGSIITAVNRKTVIGDDDVTIIEKVKAGQHEHGAVRVTLRILPKRTS